MEHFGELLKTVGTVVKVLTSAPTEDSARQIVSRIEPTLQAIDDDSESKSFKKWVRGMAGGIQVLLDDNREMDSLGHIVDQIMKSPENDEMIINQVQGDVEGEDENLVKALVWMPNSHSTGHFALELNTDSPEGYFSFWPIAGKSDYWYGIHDCKFHTYDEDVRAEKGEPYVFHLHLNKINMLQELENIKELIQQGIIKYDATTPLTWTEESISGSDKITHNCCTIIWNLLIKGGIRELINETLFDASVNINPISTAGNLTELAGSSVLKKNTTANPWSMYTLLTMVVYAERRDLAGLPRLTLESADEDN